MINGFTLHDTNTAPAASTEILNGVQKSWGFVPNLHRVLAQSPAALEAYSTLWGIAEKTSFTPEECNIVYLAIIYENECTYCMAGHINLSRMAKVEPEAISAVREGRPIFAKGESAVPDILVEGKEVTRRFSQGGSDIYALQPASFEIRALAALESLGLADIADKVPDELSGGQAQRVALAPAIALKPRLILADEPTGQLDQSIARQTVDALLNSLEGSDAALLVATHDPSVARRMETTWLMDHGRLQLTAMAEST